MLQDELFGSFLGIWSEADRTLTYWGEGNTKFDVTTINDAAAQTTEALFGGVVGDVRVASSTVSITAIACTMSRTWAPVSLYCQGSLSALEALISKSSGREQIKLQCQRSMFSGEAPVSGANLDGLRDFFIKHPQMIPRPKPWTSPTLNGLDQVSKR